MTATIITIAAAWVAILGALVWRLDYCARKREPEQTEHGPVLTRVVGPYIVTDHSKEQ